MDELRNACFEPEGTRVAMRWSARIKGEAAAPT
jgi:hypothetical protein